MAPRPLPASSSERSLSSTDSPAVAALTWAMPEPISPAPSTATVPTSRSCPLNGLWRVAEGGKDTWMGVGGGGLGALYLYYYALARHMDAGLLDRRMTPDAL